jgi:exodeoxyribonuclease V alpha subunit
MNGPYPIPCPEHGFLAIDIRLAGFFERLDRSETPGLALAVALVSRANREGHVCLDLRRRHDQEVFFADAEESPVPPVPQDIDRWIISLRSSRVVGRPGGKRPLVLDEVGRLYFFRYWEYEHLLAERILERVKKPVPVQDPILLKKMLDSLYPDSPEGGPNWQKAAVFSAAVNRFSVISGGPGTGKTTAASRALALLAGMPRSEKLRILLAAPTGKAASRLGEAIAEARRTLPISEEVKDRIPTEASTIHRLLGTIPNSPAFRHDVKNPLLADMLVVDEASMVSLALLSKLVQALPPDARLILLGDRDQLASVEAGAVLGDICDTGQRHLYSSDFAALAGSVGGITFGKESDPSLEGPVIQNSMVELRKSRRFTETSGIGIVGRAVNAGDGLLAIRTMTDSGHADVKWADLPPLAELRSRIRDVVLPWLESFEKSADPERVFRNFDRFRILCALRAGPYGASSVNNWVDTIVRTRRGLGPDRGLVPGQPFLVTVNDYRLNLFNGDIGLVLPDRESGGEMRVFFPLPDRTFRRIHPAALPSHESAWALTVHKSQGSEFDRILLILPDRDSPVLSRELVYTGLTRARDSVTVWGKREVFLEAVLRRTIRMSGLRDALWSGGG